jgi:hypothetical protein
MGYHNNICLHLTPVKTMKVLLFLFSSFMQHHFHIICFLTKHKVGNNNNNNNNNNNGNNAVILSIVRVSNRIG